MAWRLRQYTDYDLWALDMAYALTMRRGETSMPRHIGTSKIQRILKRQTPAGTRYDVYYGNGDMDRGLTFQRLERAIAHEYVSAQGRKMAWAKIEEQG